MVECGRTEKLTCSLLHMEPEVDVCSPKDGFVTKVFVQEGQPVKATTTTLLQMDTDAEDRHAERVQTRESIREIRAAQYTGPQLDLLTAIAKLAVDLATERANEAKYKRDYWGEHFALGGNIYDLELAKSDYAQSQLEQARAEAQQKQLEFAVKRHNEIDALAKRLNKDEEDFIAKRRNRLKIVSPIDGRVKKLLVAEGSFAELGSVVMEIE